MNTFYVGLWFLYTDAHNALYHIHGYTHEYMGIYAHTYVHTRVHAHTCMHTHTLKTSRRLQSYVGIFSREPYNLHE